MAACHKLTSQICAHSKALSCWLTLTSFSEIIYRTVDLHTLSSCSLLSPAICLAVRVGLQMQSILSEHAEEHWSLFFFFSFFPPESRVLKANSGHQKDPQENGVEGKEYDTLFLLLKKRCRTYGETNTLCWPVQMDHRAFNEPEATVPHSV